MTIILKSIEDTNKKMTKRKCKNHTNYNVKTKGKILILRSPIENVEIRKRNKSSKKRTKNVNYEISKALINLISF